MGILSWLLRTDQPAGMQNMRQDSQRVGETVEHVIKLHPHLRLARRYQARLAPAISASLTYFDELVDSLPAPREASAAAWATDPYIHAFFTAADDVTRVISRSEDLRAHFESNADLPEAYAVLGMELSERHILGVGLEGETLRRDVPQTTLSFSDHQLRLCGRTDADLRSEVVRRLLEQLALEGLARIAADKSRRTMLEQERALLKTRRQLLERQGSGIRAVIGSDAPAESGELERLETQLEENQRGLESLGLPEDALDRELGVICEVFADPAQHIYVSAKRLRLDRMNVVAEDNSTQAGSELELNIARIPGTPPRMRAFSLVRFARADMLPAKNMLAEAGRFLH